MNRERLTQLADLIERESAEPTRDVGFSMSSYFSPNHGAIPNWEFEDSDVSGHSCGTTACVAGWGVIAQGLYRPLRPGEVTIQSEQSRLQSNAHGISRNWLELTDAEANELFLGGPSCHPFDEVTPQMAVAVLRHAAQHDEVSWDRALEAAGIEQRNED